FFNMKMHGFTYFCKGLSKPLRLFFYDGTAKRLYFKVVYNADSFNVKSFRAVRLILKLKIRDRVKRKRLEQRKR
ncbi:MAG: hypothetical protein ABN478_04170, partial [Mixta sp.]